MRVALALLVALLMAAPSLAQTVTDANLTVTPVLPLGALSQPTSMAFVGPDDFLVLEKATGRVRRVVERRAPEHRSARRVGEFEQRTRPARHRRQHRDAARGLSVLHRGPHRRGLRARQPRLPVHLERDHGAAREPAADPRSARHPRPEPRRRRACDGASERRRQRRGRRLPPRRDRRPQPQRQAPEQLLRRGSRRHRRDPPRRAGWSPGGGQPLLALLQRPDDAGLR